MDPDFSNRYWEWLVDTMHGHNHELLFELLHSIEFVWLPEVPMDRSRESAGRHLREVFEEESGRRLPDGAIDYPASFLEVLIALAHTMEDSIMHNPKDDTDASEWFGLMLSNMGIGSCDDRWFMHTFDAENIIRRRVDDVMLRRYSYQGHGGLFPMSNPKCRDQRGLSLWYQMNDYILEKGWI